jgi:hypothetical protein
VVVYVVTVARRGLPPDKLSFGALYDSRL